MKKISLFIFQLLFAVAGAVAQSKNDTLVLHNIDWGKSDKASFAELVIPSSGSMLQGFIYTANGAGKHPTLLLLHGFPGNERNLDLAQVMRSRGWNVIYFDYRGSWGSQGNFSFKNCVEDVVNVVAFCKKNAAKFNIDTENIALFGHSMGGFVCLKALSLLPEVKKGFVLSTWDIYKDISYYKGNLKTLEKNNGNYFVLNATAEQLYKPVTDDPAYFNLQLAATILSNKKIMMLDEHHNNKDLAAAIQGKNKAGFNYEVWDTDHPFTNYRVSLIKKALSFFDK